jgi:hypothetical protein
MSSFNETVPFAKAKFRTNAVGVSAVQLSGITDAKAAKRVHIKNCHATQNLYVGRSNVSATEGYQLLAGDELVLEVEDPKEIYVVGSAASTTYSWLAY